MKKVILKAKLSSRDAFEQKLSDIELDFSPIYWQHDRIYLPREYKKNSNFPRLIMRTEMHSVDTPAQYRFILKRHIKDSSVDIVEETAIQDYEKMVNIILQLGFKPAGEVSRQRQELKMDENNIIYLDKIENIDGYFAKIESNLADDNSVAEAKLELERTFKTLGETNYVNSPYSEIN